MDAISYSYADKQAKRIKKIINDPDSTSGVLTVPKVIASGESVTIPAGRVAILPDVQVDGTLNVLGDIFIPTGTANSKVVQKVASTDNAIVRFDGTTGAVQNSGVIVDDSNNVTLRASVYKRDSDGVGVGSITSADGNGLQLNDYTSGIRFNISSLERMRIDSSGNVGIGVTPSAWHTGIKALELGSYSALYQGQGGEQNLESNSYRSGASVWTYKASGVGASRYMNNFGQHVWQTAPSGTAGNAITWTNAMTLYSDGKLVFGANTFSGRMSFTGDYAMYGDTHITMRNNSASNYGNVIFQNAAGTQVGYIQASSTATAYVTSSDYRLKDDIKPMSGSIERVMELKPCNFVWKETGHRVDGFIAHELQEVVPEAATGVKDEMMEEEYEISPRVEATYDEEGNELTPVIEAVIGKREVPKYQGIDQSKLVPLLTSALQDAILKIKSLESRIETLEGAK